MPKLPRASGPRSARLSTEFAALGVLVALLYAGNLLGPSEEMALVVLGTLAMVSIPLGIHLNRPHRRAPWAVIAVGVAVFMVDEALRIQRPSLSSVADLVALPGYVLMAVGLTLLGRSPDPGERGNVDMVLDGLMASMAALTVAWVYTIEPLFSQHGVALHERLLLASFPPLDVYLVMGAFRVAFDHRARRATAGRYLLASVIMLLFGDMANYVAEVGPFHITPRWVHFLYLFAATGLGAAALHPSMRQLSLARTRRRSGGMASLPTRGRLVLVAAALLVPSMVALYKRDLTGGNRMAVASIALATAAVATWRLFRALRASASSESRLAHQATHDELTGLPNRALVERWISRMMDEPGLMGAGMAVIFLDIDRFKLVNDTFGHSHGDLLLTLVARRIEEAIGARDVVARIGGDEFVVVLEQVTSVQQAHRRAETIRTCFDPPFMLEESEVFASASFGVSVFSTGDRRRDAESLIRDADTAMYQAKEVGRDAVVMFDVSMRERIADRLALEHDLRLAVERQEFRLEYQPIITLSPEGRRVIGLEALLRWEGPTRGLVPPGLFIGIAEDSGLIVEIGDWVIHEACRQLAGWREEAGLEELFVSVNVSALQLKKEAMLARVRGALDQSGLSPDALCIELTESLLMERPTSGVALLARLREIGVRLALDDFGTGYSSLAYLNQFHVDFVKVDKSFIDGLVRPNSTDETLVAAIVSMARALDAVTIAEGVEEPEQEDRLMEIGIDCAQGYYYARPTRPERVLDTIRDLTPRRGLRLVSGEPSGGAGRR